MRVVAIISVLIFVYSIYCIVKEIFFFNDSYTLPEKHKQVHLSILIYNGAGWCLLLFMLFAFKGYSFAIDVILVKYNTWLFLLLAAQMSTSITRHFRKERRAEDPILNYKEEFKSVVSFGFSREIEFEREVSKFMSEARKDNKDIYYINNFSENVDATKKLKKGETFDFGGGSYLEKTTDEQVHEYIFHNTKPLIFGIHIHLYLKETITPLDKDLVLYIFKGKVMNRITIKVGDEFVIPKGIKHGVIFQDKNRIKLKWE